MSPTDHSTRKGTEIIKGKGKSRSKIGFHQRLFYYFVQLFQGFLLDISFVYQNYVFETLSSLEEDKTQVSKHHPMVLISLVGKHIYFFFFQILSYEVFMSINPIRIHEKSNLM